MKKALSIILCAAMCIFIAAGCGGVKELDISSAVQQLNDAGIFDEQLTQVSESVTKKRFMLSAEDIEICTAYAGTKAVVDEIVMVRAVSDAAADNVKAAFEKHIETQKHSYENYRPSELPKLNDAIVMTAGRYAILAVSKDCQTADKIIRSCIK